MTFNIGKKYCEIVNTSFLHILCWSIYDNPFPFCRQKWKPDHIWDCLNCNQFYYRHHAEFRFNLSKHITYKIQADSRTLQVYLKDSNFHFNSSIKQYYATILRINWQLWSAMLARLVNLLKQITQQLISSQLSKVKYGIDNSRKVKAKFTHSSQWHKLHYEHAIAKDIA